LITWDLAVLSTTMKMLAPVFAIIFAALLAVLASPAFGDGDAPPKPPPFDLGSFFSPGMVMQCGNIKIFKTPDGEMQMTGAKSGKLLPFEVRGDQIFLDGKPCVLYSKCEQSVSC
jgi:hypothetical protein